MTQELTDKQIFFELPTTGLHRITLWKKHVSTFQFGCCSSKRLTFPIHNGSRVSGDFRESFIWIKTLDIKAEQEVRKKGSIQWKHKSREGKKNVRFLYIGELLCAISWGSKWPVSEWSRELQQSNHSQSSYLHVVAGWRFARQETREAVRENQGRHRLLCHP